MSGRRPAIRGLVASVGVVGWLTAAGTLLAQSPPAAPLPTTATGVEPAQAPAASTATTTGPGGASEGGTSAVRDGQAPTPADDGGLAEAERLLAPRPLLRPADPVAAAAYSVLEKHCARCHQGGRLTIPAPAAGFGNVLRLDEMAAQPHLVQPGNPEASRLYVSMLRRLMPLDVAAGGAKGGPPSAQDMAAVRTWISGLEPRPRCRDRRFVKPGDHAAAMTRAAAEAGEGAGRLRFVSIAHIYNACASFEAVAAYRQAVVKLVNSVSWKPTAVPVPAVDEARTLLRIDLADLGWLPEHWERIMQAGPNPAGLAPGHAAEVRRLFGTETPVARADWLAATVLKAPLYYDILGLPGTGPEILKILQLDVERMRLTGALVRAGVEPSQFGIQPALVERFAARTGGLWSAYHAIARDGAGKPVEAVARPLQETPAHQVNRTMFMLPNGLPAFIIVGQRGDRLDSLPPDIVRGHLTAQSSVQASLDCVACHGGGPIRFKGTGSGAAALMDALTADAKAVADAHRRLGLVAGAGLDGVEPMAALALEYLRPVSAEKIAAEADVDVAAVAALADQGEKPVAVLARRLVQGLVARAEVEASARDLAAALAGKETSGVALPAAQAGKPAAASGGAAQAQKSEAGKEAGKDAGKADAAAEVDSAIDPGPGIILYSDKARYKQGDVLNLVVRTTADCHLTLVSVDQKGRGTVIYPSDFETGSLLAAGHELKLPAQGAPYAFRLKQKGREQIVALCNEGSSVTDGITHDFERQRFTDLGQYAAYVAEHAGLEPAGQEKAAATKRPEPRQRGRRRGRVEITEQPARPEQISRTAITIVVE